MSYNKTNGASFEVNIRMCQPENSDDQLYNVLNKTESDFYHQGSHGLVHDSVVLISFFKQKPKF